MENVNSAPAAPENTTDNGEGITENNPIETTTENITTFDNLINTVPAPDSAPVSTEEPQTQKTYTPEEMKKKTEEFLRMDWPTPQQSEQEPTAQDAEADEGQVETAEFVSQENNMPAEEKEESTNERPQEEPNNVNESTEEQKEIAEESRDKTPEKKQTRAERRLEAVQKKLAEIESGIAELNKDNTKLEEEIEECEVALDKNAEDHNKLSDKVNQLRDKVNKTKRSIISGFTDGLRIVKDLALGRHQEVRELVDSISQNVNENEQALQSKEQAEQQLRVNESEKVTLNNKRADAIDAQNSNNRKVASLEKWRADLKKQESLLQEKIDEETEKKAWENSREAIKAEMGTNDMRGLRRDLERQIKEQEEDYQADLAELNKIKNPSRIEQMMSTEEELRARKERADEVEARLNAEHDKKVSAINAKLAKVNEYYPTWTERANRLRRNPSIKRGLASLKRKVLLGLYDAAA